MNQPAVSIYVITYLNSEERGLILKATCEQALKQRYPDFEVVVSDNGGSYAAADALASIEDPRLRVCTNTDNAGFTGNINRCVEHCKYDIIKPICDDDLIHPDYLSATVPLVDDTKLVVVDVEKFIFGQTPAGLDAEISLPAASETRSAGYDHGIWHLPYMEDSIPSATLFTRSLFTALGGYDSNTITSDWDFFIEAGLNVEIVHVKETLCFVGVWDGSLTEMMMGTPYFYPRESLYTKFRVMRFKKLSLLNRLRIALMILKEFIWQGLRPIRHPLSKAYWAGFAEYIRYHFRWMVRKKRQFGVRPENR
ncbi:MAG: glycosyltransferase family 2 protein [Pontiellaceae bacterium]|nr:glycosyltransferase family 2 protein [Pontiellaceae bacterium]MBN2783914.1 glycosyltransferase family 2 protein [Pontiellaceae bacterium]